MVDVAALSVTTEYDSVDKSSDALDNLGNSAESAESKTEKLGKTNKKLAAGMTGLAKKAGALALAYASISSLKIAGAASLALGTSLAEVSTLIEGTPEQLEQLGAASESLSKKFGTTQVSQAEAFYQAISAGAKVGADATNLLYEANKFAIGGVTNIGVGIDALTTSVNAYKESGLTAAQASDALFVGIRVGKTTAAELSASLGKIVPIAAQVGVSFDEVVGGVASLTTTGLSTAESVTSLNQVLVSVLKPTKEAKDEAKRLGIEFNAAALQSKGLGGFLTDLVKKGGGTTESIVKLFGSVDALKAAMALSGATGEVFNKTMEAMINKAGEADEAYEKLSKTMQKRLDVQMSKIESVVLKVGNGLVSILVPALEAASKGFEFVANNVEVLAVAMASIAATQIPLMITSMATMLAGVTAAGVGVGVLNGLLAAMRIALSLAGGPIGIAVGLLTAVAGAAFLIKKPVTEATSAAQLQKDAFFELNKQIVFFAETGAPAAGAAAVDLAKNNNTLAKSALAAAEAELAKSLALQASQKELAKGNSSEFAGPFASETKVDEVFVNNKIAGSLEAIRLAKVALGESNVVLTKTQTDLNKVLFPPTPKEEEGDTPPADGVSGGDDLREKMQSRLDILLESLLTEREALDAWKAESNLLLDEGFANGLIKEQEYAAAKLKIEEDYQKKKNKLASKGLAGTLGATSDFFGNMIRLSGTKNKKLLAIQDAFAKAEVLINTWRAAAQTLADPALSFYAKFAAVAAVVAAGMGFLSSLGGASGDSSAASAGSSNSNTSTSAAPITSSQEEIEPQRLILDFGGRPFIPAEMMKELVENLQDENKNGHIIGVKL